MRNLVVCYSPSYARARLQDILRFNPAVGPGRRLRELLSDVGVSVEILHARLTQLETLWSDFPSSVRGQLRRSLRLDSPWVDGSVSDFRCFFEAMCLRRMDSVITTVIRASERFAATMSLERFMVRGKLIQTHIRKLVWLVCMDLLEPAVKFACCDTSFRLTNCSDGWGDVAAMERPQHCFGRYWFPFFQKKMLKHLYIGRSGCNQVARDSWSQSFSTFKRMLEPISLLSAHKSVHSTVELLTSDQRRLWNLTAEERAHVEAVRTEIPRLVRELVDNWAVQKGQKKGSDGLYDIDWADPMPSASACSQSTRRKGGCLKEECDTRSPYEAFPVYCCDLQEEQSFHAVYAVPLPHWSTFTDEDEEYMWVGVEDEATVGRAPYEGLDPIRVGWQTVEMGYVPLPRRSVKMIDTRYLELVSQIAVHGVSEDFVKDWLDLNEYEPMFEIVEFITGDFTLPLPSQQVVDERPALSLHIVLEACKGRVITVSDGALTQSIRPMQRFMFDVLSRDPRGRFLAITTGGRMDPGFFPSSYNEPALYERMKDGVFGLRGNLRFVNADYSDATNRISADLTRVAWDAFCSCIRIADEHWYSGLQQLIGNTISYGRVNRVQHNGQVMGCVLSFPILCIVNAAIIQSSQRECAVAVDRTWITGPLRSPFSVGELRVNGDDALFIATPSLYTLWAARTKACGLSLSPGKNIVSRTMVLMSSRHCAFSGIQLREVAFVNFGLLTGHRRVLTDSRRPEWEEDRSLSIGACARRMVAGFSRDDSIRLLGRFIEYNRHLFPEQPWYVPEELGGIGLPLCGRPLEDLERDPRTWARLHALGRIGSAKRKRYLRSLVIKVHSPWSELADAIEERICRSGYTRDAGRGVGTSLFWNSPDARSFLKFLEETADRPRARRRAHELRLMQSDYGIRTVPDVLAVTALAAPAALVRPPRV